MAARFPIRIRGDGQAGWIEAEEGQAGGRAPKDWGRERKKPMGDPNRRWRGWGFAGRFLQNSDGVGCSLRFPPRIRLDRANFCAE